MPETAPRMARATLSLVLDTDKNVKRLFDPVCPMLPHLFGSSWSR